MKLIKTLAMLLVLLAGAASLSAQSLTVTGTVSDAAGYPLPGAAVIVDGTGNGAVTDLDGHYVLHGVAPSASIRVDILGYKPQTVKVGGRAVIDFTLEEDSDMSRTHKCLFVGKRDIMSGLYRCDRRSYAYHTDHCRNNDICFYHGRSLNETFHSGRDPDPCT